MTENTDFIVLIQQDSVLVQQEDGAIVASSDVVEKLEVEKEFNVLIEDIKTESVLPEDKSIVLVTGIMGPPGPPGPSGAAENSFEHFSKNLKSYPYVLNYTNGVLTSVVYTTSTGTITKTINRSNDVVIGITLSGNIPDNILTNKNLNYTNSILTSITYT